MSHPTGATDGADAPADGAARCTHRERLSVTDLRACLRECPERVHLVRPGETLADARDSGDCHGPLGRQVSLVLASDGGRPHVTSRETGSGLVVVADLRGVVRDDHQTEVDLVDDSLILTVGSRFVWRVPVEADRPTITDISLNNEILEARVALRE